MMPNVHGYSEGLTVRLGQHAHSQISRDVNFSKKGAGFRVRDEADTMLDQNINPQGGLCHAASSVDSSERELMRLK